MTAVAALLLCGNALATITVFDEQFSYPTGWLETVSGGQWGTWLTTAPDTIVLSQMCTFDYHGWDDIPEVVSYYSNALSTVGTATISFDFFIHEEGQDSPEGYLFIGNGNPVGNEIAYDMWGFVIDWASADGMGETSVSLWGDPVGWTVTPVATGLTVDAWHTVQVVANQTVVDPLANDPGEADGDYEVFVDGAPVHAGTFRNNGVGGLNSWDMYYGGGSVEEQHDFMAIDNILVDTTIPEPGTISIIGAGLLGLLALRRRK
jgi:hypothetical protein